MILKRLQKKATNNNATPRDPINVEKLIELELETGKYSFWSSYYFSAGNYMIKFDSERMKKHFGIRISLDIIDRPI